MNTKHKLELNFKSAVGFFYFFSSTNVEPKKVCPIAYNMKIGYLMAGGRYILTLKHWRSAVIEKQKLKICRTVYLKIHSRITNRSRHYANAVLWAVAVYQGMMLFMQTHRGLLNGTEVRA